MARAESVVKKGKKVIEIEERTISLELSLDEAVILAQLLGWGVFGWDGSDGGKRDTTDAIWAALKNTIPGAIETPTWFKDMIHIKDVDDGPPSK